MQRPDERIVLVEDGPHDAFEAIEAADLSKEIIDDDVFQRLLTFPNVIVTGHQAFLTEEALTAIAEATLASVADLAAGRSLGDRRVGTPSAAGAVQTAGGG